MTTYLLKIDGITVGEYPSLMDAYKDLDLYDTKADNIEIVKCSDVNEDYFTSRLVGLVCQAIETIEEPWAELPPAYKKAEAELSRVIAKLVKIYVKANKITHSEDGWTDFRAAVGERTH